MRERKKLRLENGDKVKRWKWERVDREQKRKKDNSYGLVIIVIFF